MRFGSSIYVNSRAIPYTSKEDITKGTIIALGMCAKFSLIVQLGTVKKASKTEAVFFPGSITKKNGDLRLLTTELLMLLKNKIQY